MTRLSAVVKARRHTSDLAPPLARVMPGPGGPLGAAWTPRLPRVAVTGGGDVASACGVHIVDERRDEHPGPTGAPSW